MIFNIYEKVKCKSKSKGKKYRKSVVAHDQHALIQISSD